MHCRAIPSNFEDAESRFVRRGERITVRQSFPEVSLLKNDAKGKSTKHLKLFVGAKGFEPSTPTLPVNYQPKSSDTKQIRCTYPARGESVSATAPRSRYSKCRRQAAIWLGCRKRLQPSGQIGHVVHY